MDQYDYLNDTLFIQELSENKIRQQYLKVTILDWNQNIIQDIVGKTLGGSINIDGASAMRRTANIQLFADDENNDLTNINNLISINKKVKIQIGIKNNTKKYLQYPILWFPQGVFVIVDASIEHSIDGVKINLTLHDKMALLNGECGGILPSSITFSEMEDEDQYGNILVTNPTISSIIKQLMVHWGNQQERNLNIKDLDGTVKQVLRWCGENEETLNYFFINIKDIKNISKESKEIFEQLNEFIEPQTEEDEFYEDLIIQAIAEFISIRKKISWDKSLNFAKKFVDLLLKTYKVPNKELKQTKTIFNYLEKIKTNSKDLLNKLKEEKNALNNALNTVQREITSDPKEFKKEIEDFILDLDNFYIDNWKKPYREGITTTYGEKRISVWDNCGKINKLKKHYRKKAEIENLNLKLNILKQKIEYVKNITGTEVKQFFYGDNLEKIGKVEDPDRNRDKYWIAGFISLAYLLSYPTSKIATVTGIINKKYVVSSNMKQKGILTQQQTKKNMLKEDIKNHSIYYFDKVDSSGELKKGIFIGRCPSAYKNHGTNYLYDFQFGIVDYKQSLQQKEKIKILSDYSYRKVLKYGFYNDNIYKPVNSESDLLSSRENLICFIFHNEFDKLKEKYKVSSSEFKQKMKQLMDYNIMNEFKTILQYWETNYYNDKFVDMMCNLFQNQFKAAFDKETKKACDIFINFIDNMINQLALIKEEYEYNIETYHIMKNMSLSNKYFTSSQSNEKITLSEKIAEKTKKIIELADNFPRVYPKEFKFKIGVVQYWNYWYTYVGTNLRDIMKYIANNSGFFSEFSSARQKNIINNNLYSFSQMCNHLLISLQNYDFEGHEMIQQIITEDIYNIIGNLFNKDFKENKLKAKYYGIRNIYNEYYKDFLDELIIKQLKDSNSIKDKRDELFKQKKQILNRIKTIQEDQKVIFDSCNRILEKWFQYNLKILSDSIKEINTQNLINYTKSHTKILLNYNNNNNNIHETLQKFSSLSTLNNSEVLTALTNIFLTLTPKNLLSEEQIEYNNADFEKAKTFQIQQKSYIKNLQLFNEKLQNIVYSHIDQSEIIRKEQTIEYKKDSSISTEDLIEKIKEHIQAREQDINTILKQIKKEKIKILQNFFNNFSLSTIRQLAWKANDSKNIMITQEWQDFYNNICIPAKKYGIKTFKYGEDVGYSLTDFIYPGELTCNIGETITSVLDKIKNALGNYEYFYDIDGHFIFQEVRNYLNTSYSTYLSQQIASNENFIFNYYSQSPVTYDFSNGKIIQSYQNTPKYQQIKNDFLVWGERKNTTGQKIPIRYHLAIDNPPATNLYYFLDAPIDNITIYQSKLDLPTTSTKGKVFYIKQQNCFYQWIQDSGYYGFKKIDLIINNPYCIYTNGKPSGTGSIKKIYYDEINKILYKWENNAYKITPTYRLQICINSMPKVGIVGNYYFNENKVYLCVEPSKFQQLTYVKKINQVNCTGTAFYLDGYQHETMGLTTNSYYTELKSEWPKLWDLLENTMYLDIKKSLTSIDYFLNLTNSSNLTNKFCISAIGKRTHVISNNSINCIFQPECPNIIFFDKNPQIEENLTFKQATLKRQNYQNHTLKEKENDLKKYNQIHAANYLGKPIKHSIYQYMSMGGIMRSAYEEIRTELYQYINYNEQVLINLLPIYCLQPNTIIKLKDSKTGINGNFLIQNFSIPLDNNSTMSMTCSKTITKI